MIHTFLAGYPREVVRRNLDAVYLLGELTIYGKSFGGTTSWASIYVKSQGVEKGFTEPFLLNLLHHEFSSILMRNYAFPKAEWQKLNPKGFRYLENDVDALDWSEPYHQEKSLWLDGFLMKYSTSSIENDFNTMSSWMFTRPDELRRLARRYPRLQSKLDLAIGFYKSIDRRFNFD